MAGTACTWPTTTEMLTIMAGTLAICSVRNSIAKGVTLGRD